MYREPAPTTPVIGSVIFLPAFAEEMNRTRNFSFALASKLVEAGFCVLQLDLSGTGDSSGEFKDAIWTTWISELYTASRWLAEKNKSMNIVSVRSGSLFLPELVQQDPTLFGKICMVEPFISGEDYATEFLQLRVARSMFEGTKESLAILTASLNEGTALEIAGYELSSRMYKSLCAGSIEKLNTNLRSNNCLVVGCGRSEVSKRNTQISELVDRWKSSGASAAYKFVRTDPFWSQELPMVPSEAITEVVEHLARAG